jgi:polar amino acid transport system permease protein
VSNLAYLWQGFWITCLFSLVASCIGVPLGLAVAALRARQVWLVGTMLALYVSFLRGIPIILLILLFHFGLAALGFRLGAFNAGAIALALNHSAFVSEIFRSAILNFPQEQVEAARSVGMMPGQVFWRIMLPQIWRGSLPALTNEITLMVKTSPAIGMIGITDLTRRASQLAASNFQPIPMMFSALLLYVVLLLFLSRLGGWLGTRLQEKYELV